MTPDPIAALMELLATSPMFEPGDGLNYVNQLKRVAERAGLKLPEEVTLYELAIGAFSDEDTGEVDWCPLPGVSDLVKVRGLRELLAGALYIDEGSRASERLTLAALDYGLHPAVTDDGVQAVRSSRQDFVGRLAARLVPATMRILAEELTDRLKICSDVGCRSPFLDRTRKLRKGLLFTNVAQSSRRLNPSFTPLGKAASGP